MLINLLPDFFAVLDSTDRLAAYQRYFAAHRKILEPYWNNYVIDPDLGAVSVLSHFGKDQEPDIHTFRIEKGKIAEHWDTLQAIPPRNEWKNSNGKF